jgi:hypothetical protein
MLCAEVMNEAAQHIRRNLRAGTLRHSEQMFVCLFVWLVAGKIKKKGIVLSRWKLLVRREGNVGGTSACYGRNAS